MMLALLLLLADAAHPPAFAGLYDGGRTEMAAGLQLEPDGRFAYLLSYGALDEKGKGRWSVEGGRLILHGDPVTPPRFLASRQRPGPPGTLRVTLTLPEGMQSDPFEAIADIGEGEPVAARFRGGIAEFSLTPGKPPAWVRLSLGMFGVEGDRVPLLPAPGIGIAFRFAPNDLGWADFRDTPLAIEGRDLILERHGRAIRFRPISGR